ncbi:MAG TPA: glycoside hydrolase family 47 protein [Pyrinomonadaceae bacterium]
MIPRIAVNASLIVFALIASSIVVAQQGREFSPNPILQFSHSQRHIPAASVQEEFLHAWNGYKKYAWGHDSLEPLSRTAHDWYGESLWMTPVDALDTMMLMGLRREANETKAAIVKNLSFDKDIYVQNFEITIRLLGGLLSAYQLSGDRRLLEMADDLGTRLLPAFNSPTGIPYRFVNLRSGKVRDPETNPAEAGTLLIEFGTLSKLTGKGIYYQKAKRALEEVYKRRSPIGLLGSNINVETGQWTNTDSHIGGGIDSYYEYLLKCWLLFDDSDCKRMWRDGIIAVNKYLSDEAGDALWYGHADMNKGLRTQTTFGSLEAFMPAVLALSGDLARAKRSQEACFQMWMLNHIEPEELNYQTMKVTNPAYALRPEIIESAYYLYHFTRNKRYREMGEIFFRDFVTCCRTDTAYAALQDVETKKQTNRMESFVFAETFKYFYLLFSPPRALPFNEVIFNTEAHPIKRTWH